jgi:hypothetical protein
VAARERALRHVVQPAVIDYAVSRPRVAAHPYGEVHLDGLRKLALDAVSFVRVAVRKPHVALAGPLAYAEVVVECGHEYGDADADA